ncbi:MAG: Hachiman antiphage defense system protein HamA [Pseudomonadota bacterium]
MSKIATWCHGSVQNIRADQDLHKYVADASKLNSAIDEIAKIVPGHYASESRIADILAKLGKTASANYVRDKLPTTPKLRFGELGEMLAASWIADYSAYQTINKLRWKDHRNMAMRGDDILAIAMPPGGQMQFLKGEVKSRKTLDGTTVREARLALRASRNRPTPHALAALADRYNEMGHAALSDAILTYQYKLGIRLDQVTHFIFTFSGNDPSSVLVTDMTAYRGRVKQVVVALHVGDPAKFTSRVFRKVIANG